MAESLLGKRKKKLPKCANPLFVQWLTEWRDEAQEKGWNSKFTYSKALSSLKKYPLPFATGKECKILEFFGEKLCKMLDKRLEEHINEHGHSHVDDDDNNNNVRNQAPLNPVNDVNMDTVKRTPGRRVIKEYIPAHRSAPYALILALYENQQSEHSPGFMLKKDLIDAAQCKADKSLSAPEPGSRYTGWSSMGSLIRKELIVKEGNPARYSITESGIELARKITAAHVNAHYSNSIITQNSLNSIQHTQSSAQCSNYQPTLNSAHCSNYQPTQNSAHYSDYEPTENAHYSNVQPNQNAHCSNHQLDQRGCSNPGVYSNSSSSQSSSIPDPAPNVTSSPALHFTYVDDTGNEVERKDNAEVMIDDDFGVGFLVKCKYKDLLMSSVRYRLDQGRQVDGTLVYVYLHDDDAGEISNPCREESGNRGHSSKSALKSNKNPFLLSDKPSVSETSQFFVANVASTDDSADSVESSQSSTFSDSFSLCPGQYSIILCVDNREHYGHAGSSKQNLLPELNKNGVNLDVRNLPVGDFAWIAKENVGANSAQLNLPKSRELVLDFIVERKRMDDLCSSIKDGRFREQKFRMKTSGLRRPIYLIEAYGSVRNFGLPEDSLNQAVINSQIVDGFQIKHTRDQKETVAYLTVMTRQLQQKFRNKTLISCSRHDIEKKNENFLLTFDEFNRLSVKNQPMRVKDLFAKQLMTLSGMSQDKAAAILKNYPSINSLVQSYQNSSIEREKENLLATIKFGNTNRNVGSALSRMVYLLYNSEKLE